MRRARAAVAALILVLAISLGASGPSAAAPSASSAAKHRCKKAKARRGAAARHGKKRCRKKRGGTNQTGQNQGGSDKPGDPTGPPGRLLATERELSPTQLQLQLSRASVAAGATIVQQYNAGSDPHNLIIERQGMVAFSFPTLDPGLNQSETVNLAHGTWTLYCSLLDHKSLGMQATLTVN
jgi:plastocyanin